MKLFLLNALICVFITFSQNVPADNLYRCGNSYQDKPCKGEKDSYVVTKKTPYTVNKASIESQSASVVNSNCQRHGETAKAIAKLRDEGKSEDQQINDSSDEASKALIKEVYNHRGSSLQIQYAFEHECMQLIEKERLTKKQMTDSERLRNINIDHSINEKSKVTKTPIDQLDRLPTSQVVTAVQSEKNTTTIQSFAKTTSSESNEEKAKPAKTPQDEGDELGICMSFKSGIDNIASQKLKGGNAAHLKDLNQQKEHLKQEMKLAGC
jgi:hypothetical protein